MDPKNKKLYIISGVVIVLVIGVYGIGKSISHTIGQKVAEKTVENVINSQTGGKANVDINNGNVKINNQQGNFEAGNNVALPADFPSDVYVAPGDIKSVSTDKTNGTFSISIEATQSAADVYKAYQDKFLADGWKVTGTMNYGDLSSVTAEKDTRTVSALISKGDKLTTIILTVGKK